MSRQQVYADDGVRSGRRHSSLEDIQTGWRRFCAACAFIVNSQRDFGGEKSACSFRNSLRFCKSVLHEKQ